MAIIPGILPSVEPQAGGQPGFTAPAVEPMRNFAPQQMEESGQALLRLGATAMQMENRIQSELDDARTKEKDTLFATYISQSLFDPGTGYMGSTGKDAVERRAKTTEEINKLRQSIEGELENDVQKFIFKQYADRRIAAASQDIDQHALRQLRQYNIGESEKRVDNLMQDAIKHSDKFLDPGKDNQYKFFRNAMAAEVKNLASLNGIAEGSEQYKALIRTADTRLHITAISNFIAAEKPALAQSYLNVNKGEIDTTQLDNVTRAVTQAKETHDVKEESLRLFLSMKGSLSEQTSALNRMFTDGKISAGVRDATVQRVEHADGQRRAARGEYERNLLGQAQQWLLNNPNRSWTDLPTSIQTGLRNAGQLDSILSFARNGRYVTQPQAYQEMISLPQTELAKMSEGEFVAKYRGRLDDSDLNTGLARLRQSKGTADVNNLQIISTSDRVQRAATDLGILPKDGKPSGSQSEAFDKFRADVTQRIRVFESGVLQNKRAANPDELKKILDEVALNKAMVPRTLLPDVSRPLSQLSEKELKEAYVMVGSERVTLASIPKEQREIIIRMLNASRKPVTEQAIAEIWVAGGRAKSRGAGGSF